MNQLTNPGTPALPVLSATTAIHGPLAKFLDPDWWLDNAKIPSDEQFYGLGIRSVVQYFKDGYFIRDKEQVEPPDGRDAPELEEYVAALNAEVPTTEWEQGLDGNPRPPWSLGYAVYLLRVRDALVCTTINSTGGHKAGVLRLRSQTQWKCFMEGKTIVPVITLGNVPFSKRYKNNRPEFHVIGSKMLTPNGFVDVPKLTGPELKKEIGDDIPF